MEIITNIENGIYANTTHWNQIDFWNRCRICLNATPLEKVSIFDNVKFVSALSSTNECDIDKPHELRILEIMLLLCCNNISVIPILKSAKGSGAMHSIKFEQI